MDLADLVKLIPLKIEPGEQWSIVGPEAAAFRLKMNPFELNWLNFSEELIPSLDGLFLAGALSAQAQAETWLQQLVRQLKERSVLVAVDWQDDGPLTYGPDLFDRFKKGRLRRLLRENGFGQVETVKNQPMYYIVSAIKGPAPAVPSDWVEVASLAELPKNGLKLVEIFNHKVVVANTGREIVAFAQVCPHAGGLLHEGRLRGGNIVCPLHSYIWNVRTGEPIEPASEDTLRRYSVRVDPAGGRVWVALVEPSA